jgi:hypothetical protein
MESFFMRNFECAKYAQSRARMAALKAKIGAKNAAKWLWTSGISGSKLSGKPETFGTQCRLMKIWPAKATMPEEKRYEY